MYNYESVDAAHLVKFYYRKVQELKKRCTGNGATNQAQRL